MPQGARLSKSKTDLSNRYKSVLSAYPNAIEFANEFNLDSTINRYIDVKTNIDGYLKDTIKLRELSECYGDKNISNWIAAWLVSLSSKMEFQITPDQAGLTSRLILEELYMINISEFSLFFKSLLKGKYGIFYGKFNIQTIILACKEFRKERTKAINQMEFENDTNN
jgi:hypothetical protein